MESLLNKGMGFVPVTSKVNISQIAADHKYFTRNMTWVEFWFDRPVDESDESEKPRIFKEKKSNFPRNHPTPEALKAFFHATQSEIMDPGNRNKDVRPNLSPAETEALSELMRLQKARVITIQRCDKGGGLILLDTPEYIRAGNNHLASFGIVHDEE